jgi:hypothetical protein
MSEQQLKNERLDCQGDDQPKNPSLATQVYNDTATYLESLRKDATQKNSTSTQALPEVAIGSLARQKSQTDKPGDIENMETVSCLGNAAELLDFSVPGGAKIEAYDLEQCDRQVINELSGVLSQLASPQSLRDFHDRIAKVVGNWQNPGEFILQAQAGWPRVEQARAAYEIEVQKNFERYGDNARQLLSRSATPTEPAERAQALARTIASEIVRAQTCTSRQSPDFPVRQAFQNWQNQIQDFALKALGPE